MAKNKNRISKQQHIEAPPPKPKNFVDKVFNLSHSGSDWRREIIAGITAFLGTAFLLLVVPRIFGVAFQQNGMIEETIAFATIVVVVLANLASGIFTNLPYILAPSIATTLAMMSVLTYMSDSPTTMFGLILIAGVIFLAITLLPLRKMLVEAFPKGLRYSAVLGLGLMLVLMGLQASGFFSTTLGNGKMAEQLAGQVYSIFPYFHSISIFDTRLLMFLIGLVSVGYFIFTKAKHPYLWTILLTTLIGLFFMSETLGGGTANTGWVSPHPDFKNIFDFKFGLAYLPNTSQWLSSNFLKMDLISIFGKTAIIGIGTVVMLVVRDIFSAPGTLFGLATLEGRMGPNDNNFKRSGHALIVQGGSKVLSGLLGAAPVEYVPESAIGIAAGGKTGITAVVYAGCAILAIFLIPLFRIIPMVALAPVFIAVGISFIKFAQEINWKDVLESIPAIVVIIMTMVTWNIAIALMWGIIIQLCLCVAVWKFEKTNAGLWTLGVVSLAGLILFYMGQ
ncbi:MAG: NCS2 family permease [Caldisericales bacterium]|nr:NCS2 family permease [Caldisericales bacterium]